jgi:hypothetical protein
MLQYPGGFKEYYIKHPNLVKKKIQQYGIPTQYRGIIWQLFTNSAVFSSASSSSSSSLRKQRYSDLLQQEDDSEWSDAIGRDVNRTFPTHIFIRDRGGMG